MSIDTPTENTFKINKLKLEADNREEALLTKQNTEAVEKSTKASVKAVKSLEDVVREGIKASKASASDKYLKEVGGLSKQLASFMNETQILKLLINKHGEPLRGNPLAVRMTHKLKEFGIDVHAKNRVTKKVATPKVVAPKKVATPKVVISDIDREYNTRNNNIKRTLAKHLSPETIVSLVNSAGTPQDLHNILKTKLDEVNLSNQAKKTATKKVATPKVVAQKLSTKDRLLNTKNTSLQRSLLNYLSPSNVAYLVDNALDPQELNDILSSELSQRQHSTKKTAAPKVSKTPLTQQQKTANAANKQLADKVTRLSGTIVNEIGQTGLDKLIYDANGNEYPDKELIPILEAKIASIKLAKNPVKAVMASSTPLTAQQKILQASKTQRIKDAGKYGQVLLGRMGESGFNSLTSGKSDEEVVNLLMSLRDIELKSLQVQTNTQNARTKYNKDFLEAEKYDKAFDKRKESLAKEAENAAKRKQKEDERRAKEFLSQSQAQSKAFRSLLGNITSPHILGKKTSFPSIADLGMGALGGIGGLLGAGVGLAGGLLSTGIGSSIKGIGGVLGGLGGNKHTVPTKSQSNIMKASNNLGGKFGGKLGKASKYGGMVGAGALKLGGKVGGKIASGAGSILGSFGLTSFLKKVPYVNAVLGAYSIGQGVYDAYQTTDNTVDFLKESAWKTSSNLASMATFGMLDAKVIEKYAKKLAGYTTDKIDQSGLVERTSHHFHKTYMNEFGITIKKRLEDGQKVISFEDQLVTNQMKNKRIKDAITNNRSGTILSRFTDPRDPRGKFDYLDTSPILSRSKYAMDARGVHSDNIMSIPPVGFNLGTTTINKNNTETINNNNITYHTQAPQMTDDMINWFGRGLSRSGLF